METPEAPRPEIADDHNLDLAAAGLAAALFVSLFLPWYTILSGWGLRVGDEAGLLALAVVLVELVRHTGSWRSHSARLVSFCLSAGAGMMGITTLVVLRWGSGAPIRFSTLRYGAWIGFAAGILLVIVAILQLNALRRIAP